MGAISEPPRLEKGDETLCVPSKTSRPARARTLVIGLGNPIVSDDSVGLRVAARLKSRLAGCTDVVVTEDYWGGLRLMERMIGYGRVIVIDAMSTGAAPGTIHQATAGEFSTQKSASAHDVDLPTALAFGRAAGALLPANEDVWLVGIEAADLVHFGDECTPDVAAAIPRAALEVVHLLVGQHHLARNTSPKRKRVNTLRKIHSFALRACNSAVSRLSGAVKPGSGSKRYRRPESQRAIIPYREDSQNDLFRNSKAIPVLRERE